MGIRKNHEITAQVVRVLGPDGSQRGVLHIGEARLMARQMNLDLVEICPDVTLPIVRIIDASAISEEKEHGFGAPADE